MAIKAFNKPASDLTGSSVFGTLILLHVFFIRQSCVPDVLVSSHLFSHFYYFILFY